MNSLVILNWITDYSEQCNAQCSADSVNNFIVVVEMLVLAFAHGFAFSYKDFVENVNLSEERTPFNYGKGGSTNYRFETFKEVMDTEDVISDVK